MKVPMLLDNSHVFFAMALSRETIGNHDAIHLSQVFLWGNPIKNKDPPSISIGEILDIFLDPLKITNV